MDAEVKGLSIHIMEAEAFMLTPLNSYLTKPQRQLSDGKNSRDWSLSFWTVSWHCALEFMATKHGGLQGIDGSVCRMFAKAQNLIFCSRVESLNMWTSNKSSSVFVQNALPLLSSLTSGIWRKQSTQCRCVGFPEIISLVRSYTLQSNVFPSLVLTSMQSYSLVKIP